MPTYEYICEDCGYEFEAFQRITADPIAVCPECKGKLRRKIGTGSGLLFKGNGFYITDYKKKAPPADEKKPKETKKDNKTKEPTSKKET